MPTVLAFQSYLVWTIIFSSVPRVQESQCGDLPASCSNEGRVQPQQGGWDPRGSAWRFQTSAISTNSEVPIRIVGSHSSRPAARRSSTARAGGFESQSAAVLVRGPCSLSSAFSGPDCVGALQVLSMRLSKFHTLLPAVIHSSGPHMSFSNVSVTQQKPPAPSFP